MEIKPSLISFIAISKRRQEILKILNEKSISQPEMMRLTNMYKSHVSRTLKELLDKRLISCRNPKDRAFRFYKITSLGKRVLEGVKKII